MATKSKARKYAVLIITLVLLMVCGVFIFFYSRNSSEEETPKVYNYEREDNTRAITNSVYDYQNASKRVLVKSDTADFESYGGEALPIEDGVYVVTFNSEEDAKKLLDNTNLISMQDGMVEFQSADGKADYEDNYVKGEPSIETELADFIYSQSVMEKGVKVAVLDTGYAKSVVSEEDAARVLEGKNFSATGGESTEDDNGHGTDVSAMIINNTFSNVSILPVKVLDSTGHGTLSALYEGIKYAIEQEVDIINISLSTASTNTILIEEAIKEAEEKGIIVVAAAGNYEDNVKNYCPANIDSVITVAALDGNLNPVKYSNYGEKVDYAGICDEYFQGTSFTAAKVTALVALLKGTAAEYDLQSIQNTLDKYVIRIEGKEKYVGAGVLSLQSVRADGSICDVVYPDIETAENWKDLSGEQLDKLFDYSSEYKNAVFWQHLTEEEKQEVYEKSAGYVRKIVTHYEGDEVEEIPLTKYWESFDLDNTSAEEYLNRDGYCHIQTLRGGSVFAKIKVSVTRGNTSSGSTSASVTVDRNDYLAVSGHNYMCDDMNHDEYYDEWCGGYSYNINSSYYNFSHLATTSEATQGYTDGGYFSTHNHSNGCGNGTFSVAGPEGLGMKSTAFSNPDAVWGHMTASIYYNPWQHTVAFNANGGSGAPGSQIKTWGAPLQLSSTKPTRAYYNFVNWKTSGGSQYDPGGWYGSDQNGGTVTLYAQWSPYKHTINFNANGGSGAPGSLTKTYGQALTFPSTKPTRPGYEFVGWAQTTDASSLIYEGKTTIVNGTYIKRVWLCQVNNTTLEVLVQADGVGAVALPTWSTAGGQDDIVWYSAGKGNWERAGYTYNYGKQISIHGSDTGPYLTHVYAQKNATNVESSYSFDNSNKAYTLRYCAGDNYTPDQNGGTKTFYAQWEASSTVVKFDANGGNDASWINCELWPGTSSNCLRGVITRPNYEFAGWTRTRNGIDYVFDKNGYWVDDPTYWKADGGSYNGIPTATWQRDDLKGQTITLYAKWVPKVYHITLDKQGGSGGTHDKYYHIYNTLNTTRVADNPYAYNLDDNTGIATLNYKYTGGPQMFNIPYPTDYTLTVAGAQGGSCYGGAGGLGGTSSGKISLKKGDTLQIYVGNQPSDTSGGFNGGGKGTVKTTAAGGRGGGGGATDIRKGSSSLDNRIIVAGGGGGGATYQNVTVCGGTGGGLEAGQVGYIKYTGAVTTGWTNSTGATQSSSFKYNTEKDISNMVSAIDTTVPFYAIAKANSGTSIGWVGAFLGSKGQGSGHGAGGGYYGGSGLMGNNMVAGGFGGSGYIGGVTNGSMSTGTNKGNGWAKISFRAKDAANHNRNNYVGKPTKTGYIFKGYYTGANGTGTQVVDSDGYIVDANNSFTSNTTVYAYWKPITYSVAYSTGATPYVSGTNPDSQYVTYDEVFNLRAYNHKGLVGMPYKITFNGNKPAGASTNVSYLSNVSGNSEFSHYTGSDSKTYTNAQSVSKLMTVQSSVIGMTCQWNSKRVTPTKPTLPGYTFLGWATSATGAVNSNYNSFDIVPSTTAFSLALYAKWQPNNYTITFNYNKPSVITTGTMSGNSTTTKTVTFDKAVGNLPTPTLGTSGSVQFVGWFDANGNQWTANTVYKTVGNTTLTARWKYLIEFDANKPSSASSSITGTTASVWALYGTTYKLTTNGFALTGYTFGGWNTLPNGTGTNYADGASISNLLTNANGRFILYGKWTANSYKLSYGLNKPSTATYTPVNGSGNPSTAKYDQEITINNPSLTGWTFTGWTISGYNTNTAVVDGSRYSATSWVSEKRTKFKNLTPVKDATVSFTANWSVNQYKIAYNLNKPSNASNNPMFGTNHPTAANFESTVTIDNPSLKGWTFKGWTVTGYNTNTAVVNGSRYSGATLTGTKVTSFKNLTPTHGGTVTFTAVWEPNTYTVVIKPGRPTSPKSLYDVTVMATPSGWTYASTNKYFKKVFTYDSTTIGLTSDKFYKLTGYTPTGSFYTGQNSNGTGNGTTFTSASKNLTAVNNGTVTLYSGWVDDPPVIRVLTDDEMYNNTIWNNWGPIPVHKGKLFNNDVLLIDVVDLGSGLHDCRVWDYEVNSWSGSSSTPAYDKQGARVNIALLGNQEINNLTDYTRMNSGIRTDGFLDWNGKFARVVTDWVQTEIDYNDPTSTKASYSPAHKKISSCWRYKDSTTINQWKETGEWTNLPTPTREGFTFNGWVESSVWTNQLKPNANYETLAPTAVNGIKGKYTPKASKKFYASWMRNKYNVTYNYTLNGGTSFSDASGNVKQFYYNADRGLPTSYDVKLNYAATKNGDTGVYSTSNSDGWKFMGWHTSNSNDQKQALTSFSMPARDVTLYALFKKHLVATFNQHEKVNADADTVLKTTKYEDDVWNRNTTTTLKENTLKQIYDWTNLGWTTQTAPKSTVTNNFTIWQDTVYYAQYRRWQTIRFTNMSTEKTFEDWQYRNSYSIHNLTGINYTVPAQQVYKNWKSIGWADKPAADASVVRLSGKQYHDTFDKQFWSRYEKDVIVDYSSSGGLTTPPPQVGKANYNSAKFVKYPIFKVAPAITKYSAKFVEWNSDRLGAGTSYIPNTSYKFMFSTTLHARWETIDVKSIKLDKDSIVMVVGETAKVTPTVEPLNASNGNVVYSVADPSIVEIGANAELIGKKSGTTKVTVRSVSNPEVYAECTVTVCSASVSVPKLVVANSPFEVTVSSTSSQKTASLKCSYISNLTGKTTGKTYGMELFKKVGNGYTKQYLDKENEAENVIVSSNSKTPGKATLLFRTKESENSMVNDVYDGKATFKLELK